MADATNGDGKVDPRARAFSVLTNPPETRSTVILGAGIMGCATAYYLATSGNTKPDTIHLVEASPELFASASGKAAGFVASDWFEPPTASLGALSFHLHQELADKHDGLKHWGYSRSTATSLMEGRRSSSRGDWLVEGGSRADVAAIHEYHSDETGPIWMRKKQGDSVEMLSERGGVAQVDPLRLCQFLLRESILKGVRLHHPATAVKISQNEAGEMSGVRFQHAESGTHHKIPCTRLLITSGAWTPSVFTTLFPASNLRIGISPLAGHSLVIKSPRWTKEHETKGCDGVFTTMRSGFSPEIFSRLGEEIYIAGLNDASIPLPSLPTDAKIDPSSIDELTKISEQLLGKDGTNVSDLQVIREGLCFRPVTRNGVPILCQIPDKDLGELVTKPGAAGGVFVAVGHGPWGISQSLGTGKVMAEMLERQKTSADVSRLGMQ